MAPGMNSIAWLKVLLLQLLPWTHISRPLCDCRQIMTSKGCLLLLAVQQYLQT